MVPGIFKTIFNIRLLRAHKARHQGLIGKVSASHDGCCEGIVRCDSRSSVVFARDGQQAHSLHTFLVDELDLGLVERERAMLLILMSSDHLSLDRSRRSRFPILQSCYRLLFTPRTDRNFLCCALLPCFFAVHPMGCTENS